jgi:hypothetical protein
MKPQQAGLWAERVQFRAASWARLAQIFVAFLAVLGDAALAAAIVVAALLAWSPRIGLESAKETLALRRARRRHIAEIGHLHGAVWARHARRRPEIWARYGKLRD